MASGGYPRPQASPSLLRARRLRSGAMQSLTWSSNRCAHLQPCAVALSISSCGTMVQPQLNFKPSRPASPRLGGAGLPSSSRSKGPEWTHTSRRASWGTHRGRSSASGMIARHAVGPDVQSASPYGLAPRHQLTSRSAHSLNARVNEWAAQQSLKADGAKAFGKNYRGAPQLGRAWTDNLK
jgi:hypothetical protein